MCGARRSSRRADLRIRGAAWGEDALTPAWGSWEWEEPNAVLRAQMYQWLVETIVWLKKKLFYQ